MTATPAAGTVEERAATTAAAARGWRALVNRVLIWAAAGWLTFVLVHLLLDGYGWFWLIVDAAPPAIFLVVPVLIAATASLCRRSRRNVAILALLAFLAGLPISGVNFAYFRSGDGPAPPGAITVLSWNTEYWDQGGQTAAMYALLKAQQADIYLLQEYVYDGDQPAAVDELAQLRAAFPGYDIATAGELVTISRFPILREYPLTDPGVPAPETTGFPAFWLYKVLRADVRLPGGDVLSTYNVHMPVGLVPGNPFTAKFYTTVEAQQAQREPQWRALARDVDANPGPALVAGDFNTTPAMGDLDRVPGKLRDASYALATIYPVTWYDHPKLPLWWRLDWAFVSSSVLVHSYRFGASHGISDHRYQKLVISLRA